MNRQNIDERHAEIYKFLCGPPSYTKLENYIGARTMAQKESRVHPINHSETNNLATLIAWKIADNSSSMAHLYSLKNPGEALI
jgi:hypothetical protein